MTVIDERILNLRKAVMKTDRETAETIMDLGAVEKSSIATDSGGAHLDWNNDWTEFHQWVNE